MSSYISSFRALFAALITIAAAEVAYSAVDDSSAVERSTYLNWNFNEPELFHKVLIYEKLRSAIVARPDIIQVGDSSGLHGIVPSVVEEYIPGLKYVNLSCCANTGYDGYYTIADFMLRHVPSIKVVVLYVAWNNTQAPDSTNGQVVGGPDRIRSAFGPMASLSSPPSLAARENTVRAVHTLGGALNPLGSMPFDHRWPAMLSSLRAQQGWLIEQDKHRTSASQDNFMRSLCHNRSATGWNFNGPYEPNILGRPQSYIKVELMRLARLTARHNAKLIVMFQPYPCQRTSDSAFIAARIADVAAVAKAYPNVVIPAALFEHWPSRQFTSADHLRTGNEDLASKRVGRAVAKTLDASFVEPPPTPLPGAPHTVWSANDYPSPPWRYDNIRLMPEADGGGTVATETATEGWHRLEMTLPDLPPKTYVLSAIFSKKGSRQLLMFMRDLQLPGAQGAVHCNAETGESFPIGDVLDWAIEELPGDLFRCLARLKMTKTDGVIGFGLAHAGYHTGPYAGDGRSGIVIHGISLSSIDEAKQ